MGENVVATAIGTPDAPPPPSTATGIPQSRGAAPPPPPPEAAPPPPPSPGPAQSPATPPPPVTKAAQTPTQATTKTPTTGTGRSRSPVPPHFQDTYEKIGPTSKIVAEPPPPPDLASFSYSSTRRGRIGRGAITGKKIESCVYVFYAAIGLWVLMAIWTFFLYAHSVELMNLVPVFSFLAPSELDSLLNEEE